MDKLKLTRRSLVALAGGVAFVLYHLYAFPNYPLGPSDFFTATFIGALLSTAVEYTLAPRKKPAARPRARAKPKPKASPKALTAAPKEPVTKPASASSEAAP
jgi:hypothetical protein